MTATSSRPGRDTGFTLIELLMSMSIIGIVLGAVTSALIVFLKNSEYTIERDDHSAGAMLLSTYLDRDFASADSAAVSTWTNTCGNAVGATQVLLLTWAQASATAADPQPDPVGGGTFAAAYTLTDDPDASGRKRLVRTYCVSNIVTDTSVLTSDLASADTTGSPSGICGVLTNPTPTAVRLTLTPYRDDTAASAYTYTGCLKGRLR